ncbi:ClpP class periplasmic serine protease [Rhodoplanes sp. Z2-YC6860]|nr:hypothetical protein [Rhodoplanes sp. Z2-YC6860]AMN42069.1 ClpP class periplasmic serine protease [Rhodoplanes sp. Z2-YC6860]
MPIPQAALTAAQAAAAKIDADVYVYNGSIEQPRCLTCIEAIASHRSGRKKARLFLTTNGGNPDAAYKITRYFQEKYEHFTVIVAGKCKSAGTLIAVGAHELAFTPYGELGPLDIQLSKVDKFDALSSGLTIQDSLNTLEARAVEKFFEMVKEYIQANNGQLSFASATKAAGDFVAQLYAPVFARIDPEDVGARARSMRIGTDYGRRLSLKSQNLRADTLRLLSETYSSHSFVIDQQEAETLFLRVRVADAEEEAIVAALGRISRFQGSEFVFQALSVRAKDSLNAPGAENGTADLGRDPTPNGGNSQRANGAAGAPAVEPKKRRGDRRRDRPVAEAV